MKSIENAAEQVPAGLRASSRPLVASLASLFKLRVVGLLLFAAVAGACLGAGGWPGGARLALLVTCGALTAGGASAINEYLEREVDAGMQRTRERPLVTGAILPGNWVLFLGAAMIGGPVMAVLPYNAALALFLAVGAIIYIGVYTLWLKPRTALNVVIGGAAGSCAVLSGGAAVGAWSDPGVLGLALLVFLWSPVHFWSLALACREDYARANVPMLPVVTTPRRAALLGLLHAAASAVTGMVLAWRPAMGLFFLVPVFIASTILLAMAVQLVLRPSQSRAWRLFHSSNGYLAVVLLAACLTAVFHLP